MLKNTFIPFLSAMMFAGIASATPIDICKLSLCTDLQQRYQAVEKSCVGAKNKTKQLKKLHALDKIYDNYKPTLDKNINDLSLVSVALESAHEVCGDPIGSDVY